MFFLILILLLLTTHGNTVAEHNQAVDILLDAFKKEDFRLVKYLVDCVLGGDLSLLPDTVNSSMKDLLHDAMKPLSWKERLGSEVLRNVFSAQNTMLWSVLSPFIDQLRPSPELRNVASGVFNIIQPVINFIYNYASTKANTKDAIKDFYSATSEVVETAKGILFTLLSMDPDPAIDINDLVEVKTKIL